MKKKTLVILTLLFIGMFCTVLMADDTWVCQNCGQTVTGNFCGKCGAAKPEKWQCPKCGKKGQESNFCTNCGYEKLQEVKDPETVFSFEVNEDNTATITRFSSDNEDVFNSFMLPDSIQGHQVTVVGSKAFSGCTGLTRIEIPDSVTTIEDLAFAGCTSLTSIDIPDSVTTIEGNAFSGCTSLTSIDIPDSVTTIELGTFSGCTSLTSIEIPDSVTTIGYDDTWYDDEPEYEFDDGAFSGCTSLESIEIPDFVTYIGIYTFSGCTGLTSIEVPGSVTEIDAYAFDSDITLIVEEDSYAEEYAIDHEYEYFYSEEYSDSTEYEDYYNDEWIDLSLYLGASFDDINESIPDLTMVESSPDKEKWENGTISVTGTGDGIIVRIRMDTYSDMYGIYDMVPGISPEDAEEFLEGYEFIYQGSSEDGWKVYMSDYHYVAYKLDEEGLVGSIYVAEDGYLPIDYVAE